MDSSVTKTIRRDEPDEVTVEAAGVVQYESMIGELSVGPSYNAM